MNPNRIKRKIAAACDLFGMNALGLALQRRFLFPYIRVVNYHDVPPEHASNFEDHLRYYSSHFINVDEASLRGFLNGTPWGHSKPGIILSFDDGLASHAEIVAPALEKYGFTGWFFVPAERVMPGSPTAGPAEDNAATREQILQLARRHVVGCHTWTHCRLAAGLSEDTLKLEVLRSKADLTEALGREVSIFCWVGGEEYSYSREAAELIRTAYDLSFMTNNAAVQSRTDPLQLQRTNIEAENPLSLLKFQISGFLDLLYLPKRRRVNALTR